GQLTSLLPLELLLYMGLLSWIPEASSSAVIYNSTNITEYANMMYYKSTKAGCAYRVCNTSQPPVLALACAFNNAPKLGEPFLVHSNGCRSDSDCEKYLPFSKCELNTTLCLAGNATFP
ncbi:hypothetical protein TELCIR_17866, partial [Teladorsagia circumcincta]